MDTAQIRWEQHERERRDRHDRMIRGFFTVLRPAVGAEGSPFRDRYHKLTCFTRVTGGFAREASVNAT